MTRKRTACVLGTILGILVLVVGLTAVGQEGKRPSFAIDFPKYIGVTVDSLVKDIGQVPEYSDVYYLRSLLDDGKISYSGCYFTYPQGVQIQVRFDSSVDQPPGRSNVIRDVGYFKNETIGELEITIECRSGDQE